ncbi:MAG TPA: hypothetical protein VHI54_08610 [Actinomycetota bacterium]|nr:hypothetical protein [Actinomycetota bacterium]
MGGASIKTGRGKESFSIGRTTLIAAVAASIWAVSVPTLGLASHRPGDSPRIFGVGTGRNEFIPPLIGEVRLSVAAHRDQQGRPTGHVEAHGDPDGLGPIEPFSVEGPVTCIEVRHNRAAIKYRFKHAEGSAEPFLGGGNQFFLEDNGEPRNGVAVDRTAFDAPQIAAQFELANPEACDDPNSRLLFYDLEQSGNFVVDG